MEPKINIKTTAGQGRLTPRNDPYWLVLFNRAAIGFRKPVSTLKKGAASKKGGMCSWVARWRETGGGKKHYHALGTIEELPTYTLAKREAEEWVKQMESGITKSPSRGTLWDALDAYLSNLRKIGRDKAATAADARFKLTVGEKPFGKMKLENVTRDDVDEWREGLKATRANRSVNRQVRQVVAALNFAVDHGGHIGNKRAWKLQQLIEEGASKPRAYTYKGQAALDEGPKEKVFLTPDQTARLIAAASPTLAAFMTGLSHTGSRPGELAAATVADFNAQGGSITLSSRKGKGGKVKVRAVWLSDVGVAFFKAQAKGKLPKAPLISNEFGEHFTDQQWCGGIEKARDAAGAMPTGTTAYAFRHTRVSELLQTYGIDPLSAAVQIGTSLEMFQRTYFHLIPDQFRAKLNAVKSG
jgi:integrase